MVYYHWNIIAVIVIIWLMWDLGRKYISTLRGSQAVPPVDTVASGGIMFYLNSSQKTLSYSGKIKDIPFQSIKSISLHKGKIGTNGPPIQALPGKKSL